MKHKVGVIVESGPIILLILMISTAKSIPTEWLESGPIILLILTISTANSIPTEWLESSTLIFSFRNN